MGNRMGSGKSVAREDASDQRSTSGKGKKKKKKKKKKGLLKVFSASNLLGRSKKAKSEKDQSSGSDVQDTETNAVVCKATTQSIDIQVDECQIGKILNTLDLFKAVTGEGREAWRLSEVIASDTKKGRVKVSYLGWGKKYEEWLQMPSRRLKPCSPISSLVALSPSTEVFAKDIFKMRKTGTKVHKWRRARVIEVDLGTGDGRSGPRAKVHFVGWQKKWDTWMELGLGRLYLVPDSCTAAAVDAYAAESSPSSTSNGHAAATPSDADVAASRRKGNDRNEHSHGGGQGATAADPRALMFPKAAETHSMRLPATVAEALGMLPTQGSRVGLRNLGNTCFMNASLQCLAHIPDLAACFHKTCQSSQAGDIYNTSSITEGELAHAFIQLTHDLWNRPAFSYLAPTDVKDIIGHFAPRFADYEQQDCQEFLRFLIDGLHEDLNRVRGRVPYREVKEKAGEADEALAERYWQSYGARNDSVVKDLFCGQLRSLITCSKCGYRSAAFEPFWDLSVPLPRKRGRCSLEDCLKAFGAPEKMHGTEKYFCHKCQKRRNASKQLSVWRLPRVLCLHVKRFSFGATSGYDDDAEKLETRVQFPTTGLDLRKAGCCGAEWLAERRAGDRRGGGKARSSGSVVYDLVGVAYHHGTLDEGHYTAACADSDRQWYTFDDRTVEHRPDGPSQYGSSDETAAYVFFYIRSTR